MNPDDHTASFLPIIWTYIQQYKLAKVGHTKVKIKEGLKDALKKWTDMPVAMISEGTATLAANTSFDPFHLMWHHRNRFGKDPRGKSLILWEHTTPLQEVFEQLVKFDSEEEVRVYMSSYSGVCWITRDEDNRLNDAGYKSNRPGGWLKWYLECNIKVVTRQSCGGFITTGGFPV